MAALWGSGYSVYETTARAYDHDEQIRLSSDNAEVKFGLRPMKRAHAARLALI